MSLHKGDVSIVSFGANPHTSASLRSALPAFACGKLDDRQLAELRAMLSGRGGKSMSMGSGTTMTMMTTIRTAAWRRPSTTCLLRRAQVLATVENPAIRPAVNSKLQYDEQPRLQGAPFQSERVRRVGDRRARTRTRTRQSQR